MTSIAIISDTHGLHENIKIPEVDLLIHCGDFSNMGRPEEIIKFAAWLHQQPCKKAIVIAGNHDFIFEKNSYVAQVLLMRNEGLTSSKKVVYLQDQSYEYEGIKFYGTPWTNKFYDWAFMLSEDQLKEKFDRIPEDTQILITHGPPKGILDKNNQGYKCGSQALRDKVDSMKLKYVLFGHIHPSHGIVKNNNTIFINAASLDDNYNTWKSSPILIKI